MNERGSLIQQTMTELGIDPLGTTMLSHTTWRAVNATHAYVRYTDADGLQWIERYAR